MERRSSHEYSRLHIDEVPTKVIPTVQVPSDISQLPTLPIPTVHLPPASAPPPSVTFLSWLNARILGLFVTNPSSGQSLAYVDGLRALAALSVVLLHVQSETSKSKFVLPIPFMGAGIDFGPIITHGGVGVYLFFILSGFLLAQPWIEANYKGKSSLNLKHYFILRFTRIIPAYYTALFIVIVFFTPALVSATFVYSRLGLFNLVAHLLFLQFIFPVSSTSFRIALQFWSLTIEMLFYCMLPLLVRAFYRRRWMAALPVGALISLLYFGAFLPIFSPILLPKILHLTAAIGAPWYNIEDASFYLQNQFPAHAFEFALGITLANLHVRRRLGYPSGTAGSRAFAFLTHRVTGNCMFVAGCVISLTTIYQISFGMPLIRIAGVVPSTNPVLGWRAENTIAQYFEFIESIGFGLILAGVSYGDQKIRDMLGFTPIRIIGIVSYSIYLLHLPLLHNVMLIFPVLHQSPNTLFVKYLFTLLAQILPFSILLYLIVEQPSIRWARRRMRPAPATGGAR